MFIKTLQKSIELNLVKDNRYLYLLEGLKNTLIITFFATIIGVFLGLIIALIRTTNDNMQSNNQLPLVRAIIKIFDAIAKIYLTVIRGTPVVVQLMILFFVIFTQRDANGVMIAILGFGLNSAAYVAEIFRSGLMSIDVGQMEAGRSLGFDYVHTMVYIIIPQAFKVVLPSLCNEFIVLIKETSIAGYVAVQDLTKGGDIIRSRTYDAWFPLLMVATIYLLLTCVFSFFVKKLERNLRKNER